MLHDMKLLAHSFCMNYLVCDTCLIKKAVFSYIFFCIKNWNAKKKNWNEKKTKSPEMIWVQFYWSDNKMLSAHHLPKSVLFDSNL